MPRFAANLSLLFTDVEFLARPAAAAAAGFTGVECQFPYHVEADALADKLAMAEVPLVLMNAPPGDFAAGELGLAALKGREEEFRDSLEVALRYADMTECTQLHVMAGKVADDDVADALDVYMRNLAYAADACAEEGVMVVIEPIFMDNYLISRPDQAVEILRQVDHNNLRLQYDIYHAQRSQGGISEFIENHFDLIQHIQIAGVPDRHEPDKLGEVNWRYLFDLLDAHGYAGWIGAEYNPRAGTVAGLAWGKDWGIGG